MKKTDIFRSCVMFLIGNQYRLAVMLQQISIFQALEFSYCLKVCPLYYKLHNLVWCFRKWKKLIILCHIDIFFISTLISFVTRNYQRPKTFKSKHSQVQKLYAWSETTPDYVTEQLMIRRTWRQRLRYDVKLYGFC